MRAVLGAAIPEYSLAVWHGFTPELLMSVVAMAGGVAVYVMLRPYLLASDGPPLLRHIKGQRIFDRVLVTLSWRLARWLEDVLGTRRLQPQLQLLVCAAFVAAHDAALCPRARASGARRAAISTWPSRCSGRSGSPARSAPPIKPSSIASRR